MKRFYDLADVSGCEPGALPDYRCEPIEDVGTSRPRHMLLDEDKAEAFRRTLLEYHAIQMQVEREYEELYKTIEWVENEAFGGYSPFEKMLLDSLYKQATTPLFYGNKDRFPS
jgi:hypothetical protein